MGEALSKQTFLTQCACTSKTQHTHTLSNDESAPPWLHQKRASLLAKRRAFWSWRNMIIGFRFWHHGLRAEQHHGRTNLIYLQRSAFVLLKTVQQIQLNTMGTALSRQPFGSVWMLLTSPDLHACVRTELFARHCVNCLHARVVICSFFVTT